MVNEGEFKEGTVLIPKTFPDLNWDWFNSVPKWYFTYWSKIELIREAGFLKKVPVSELPGDILAQPNNSLYCAKMSFVHGFGLKRVPYKLEYNEEKALVWGEDGETHHFVFSDNATYVIGVTTWKDGENSWLCWNTKEDLESDLKNQVLKYVCSLGFKPEMAIETPFKN